MKKYAIIGLICAMVGTAALPAVTSFADTTNQVQSSQSANTANTDQQSSSSNTAEQSNQNSTDGPVFHVSTTKLLVKIGANLDLKKALDVTVTDPYDTNLQDQIKDYPTINTSKPGDYNFTMKVTDSKGKTASQTVNINVIGAKPDLTLPNIEPSALTQKILNSLVEGNIDGLKVTYTKYDGTNKTFDLVVSNGQDSLTFPIQMKQGALPPLLNNNQKHALESNTVSGNATTTPVAGSSAGSQPTVNNTNASSPVAGQSTGSSTLSSSNAKKSNLPKTGMVFVSFFGCIIAGCIGVLLYTKSKYKKKGKLEL